MFDSVDPEWGPLAEDWWMDRLRAMHALACDTEWLSKSDAEPWVKLSGYDISRMASLLARTEVAAREGETDSDVWSRARLPE